MAKKLYAVTNVKLGPDREYAAGVEIDKNDFDKDRETLKQLVEAGAVEIRDEAATVASAPEEDHQVAPGPVGSGNTVEPNSGAENVVLENGEVVPKEDEDTKDE